MKEAIGKLRATVLPEYLTNIWRNLHLWLANPWFAYISILLLQLKMVWGAWQHKDLTSGDTSAYFMSAYGWAKEFSANIEWSPLYTTFYGTLLKLVNDVYLATLLHRLVIVFALAVMVLALMRRLLPVSIAWLIAAWWVIMPINFDSLYEVHLFAVLLPLAVTLLVLYRPNIWTRGGALGILLASTLLIRNEIIIAICLWALICLIWELRQIKLHQGKTFKIYLFAYGLPVLFAILVFGFFYWRTPVKPSPESLARKHTLNVCQIYAFGYQQRNSDWTKSPWTECQDLMLRVFGKPEPALLEALQANPPAMLAHFFWNLRLLPAGLQVALFNASSESVNPDYAPVLLNQPIVLVPTFLSLGLLVIALINLYRQKQYWWTEWLKERAWGWAMLFCLAAVMTIVIPMQRPRPSYMFLLTLFLMAILGMCLFITIRQLAIYQRIQQLIVVMMIGMFIFIPSYYSQGTRPFLKLYRELYPSEEFLGVPGTAIVTLEHVQELCNYFTKSSTGGCVGYGYEVFDGLTKGESVAQLLERQPIPVVALYVNQNFLDRFGSQPAVKSFLTHPKAAGWKMVASQDSSMDKWQLYVNVKKFNVTDP